MDLDFNIHEGIAVPGIKDTYARWSAYAGVGWQARASCLADDVQNNEIWRRCGEDSEYGKLQEVALFIPDQNPSIPEDVNRIQFLSPINFSNLRQQLNNFASVLENCGIQVHRVCGSHFAELNRECAPPINLLYTSDLILSTKEGIIVGRMGSAIRAGEEKYLTRAIADLGIPILATIRGEATLEASDVMWVRPKLVFVGIGARTNRAGFQQIKAILKPLGISAVPIKLPTYTQHLQGIIRLTGPNTAIIRQDFAPRAILAKLRQLNVNVTFIRETVSVAFGQIMNFLVIDEGKIITCCADPEIEARYREAGLHICETLDVSELLKGAGGLACATATIRRDLISCE